MLISELARQTGLSKDTIRFYEKSGLLGQDHMSRLHNNYRDYGQAALNRFLVLANLKEFGFSLSEIGEMVQLYESNPKACRENIPKIQAKVQALDKKITRLMAFRDRLQTTITDCLVDCENTCGLDKTLSGLNHCVKV